MHYYLLLFDFNTYIKPILYQEHLDFMVAGILEVLSLKERKKPL